MATNTAAAPPDTTPAAPATAPAAAPAAPGAAAPPDNLAIPTFVTAPKKKSCFICAKFKSMSAPYKAVAVVASVVAVLAVSGFISLGTFLMVNSAVSLRPISEIQGSVSFSNQLQQQQRQRQKQRQESENDLATSTILTTTEISADECASMENKFYCPSSRSCISDLFICDGVDNCLKGEDETNCSCDGYRCRSGRCISVMLTCDGINDCADGDDESFEYCNNSPKSECENSGKFWCGDVLFANCLEMEYRCDGVRFSCGENRKHDDEANCLNFTTPVTAMFKGVPGFHVCVDEWKGTGYADVLCQWAGFVGMEMNGATFKNVIHKDKHLNVYLNDTNNAKNGIGKFIYIKNVTRLKDGELKQIAIESTIDSANGTKTCKKHLDQLKCTRYTCGTRDKSFVNTSRIGYIIKGVNVLQETQWPWFASIEKHDDETLIVCGASILSPRFIITAAHCVSRYLNKTGPNNKDYVEINLEDIEVTVGKIIRDFSDYSFETLQKTKKKNAGGPNIKVIKLHIHKNYSKEIYNDVAILELEKDLEFGPAVKPICLPAADMQINLYRLCVSVGYGITAVGHPSRRLQQVRLMPYSESMCKLKIGHVFDGSHMMCAGTYGGMENICLGDSGGPLMCRDYEKDVWFIEGVSGFTAGSLDFVKMVGEDSPLKTCETGIYMRVGIFKEWIESIIRVE